ncbi:hypothetical protein BKA57DRAFT_473960 [Linnemannia elongata]|nr:hypothetical protein BKA57DRAFT_473960 [Linnemannia elongata]
MDQLLHLPSEILFIILQTLLQDNKEGSLASLLQTNKYLAAATLPVLYSKPFQNRPATSVASARVNDGILACMLLRQLPVDTLSPLITFALGDNTTLSPTTATTTTTAKTAAAIPTTARITRSQHKQQLQQQRQLERSPLSRFDYFSHIRHLLIQPSIVEMDCFGSSSSVFPVKALEYMERPEFFEMCQSYCLWTLSEERLLTNRRILRGYYQVLLLREVSWSLSSSIFDQLQTLTLPLSDLDRYSGAMDRLGNLRHIVICVDQAVKCNWQRHSNTTPKSRAATEARQESLLRTLVHFVEEHTTRFPGRLKTLGWSKTLYSPDPTLTCRERVELEMLRLLPPIRRPTMVTNDTLNHIWTHLPSTDLAYVRSIEDFRLPMSWIRTGGVQDCQHLLQRCRALDVLHMATVGQGVFDWAVKETKDLGHSLVPLRRIEIIEIGKPLTNEFDDISCAFSRTIETIKVFRSNRFPVPHRPMHVGRGCVDLPALTHLEVAAKQHQLMIDRELFRHCPRLRTVDLTDETSRYQCKDIATCLPGDLPCLESLRLLGWGALTFHPATLHSTQMLKKLTLGSVNLEGSHYFRYYIPSDEELEGSFGAQDNSLHPIATKQGHANPIVRPPWTWDWHLPGLEHLTLTAEFAYRFQFRMLHGCTSLVELELNCTSVHDRPTSRVLSVTELLLPIIDSDHHHFPGAARQAVVAPALQNVRLRGSWTIDDSLLPQFFTVMLPNLKSFEGVEVNGFTMASLVDVLKKFPNKIEELRLPSKHRFSRERARGEALLVNIFYGHD